MTLKTRDIPLRIKAVSESGLFSGYGSVYGTVDSYNEVVAKGAFSDSLAEWKGKNLFPSLLWQHRSSEPLGVYTSMTEDDKGLRVEGQLLIDDVQQAREAYALLKAGAVNGLSIGYKCDNYTVDEETGITTLNKIDLWEVSLVTFPANTDATIDMVKAALRGGHLPTLPEFEDLLREAGFSKSQAKAIAGKGLSHLLQREAGSQSSNQLADILSAIKTI